MKKKVILILVLWLFLVMILIGYKEYTLASGTKYLLKTQPVDPRDMFRGDYVVLNYDISRVSIQNSSADDSVYVYLKQRDKYWIVDYASLDKGEGPYIKGRIKYASHSTATLEYGIESYFVPEGKGKELENAINKGWLDVEISVDKFGKAVISRVLINDTEI